MTDNYGTAMTERLRTTKKQWKKHKTDTSFYDFAKSPEIKKALKGLMVPDQVKQIQGSIDKIKENDGILVLNSAVDLATVFIIYSHKNAKFIKEIRQLSWAPIELEKIKGRYSKNIAEFQRLFRTEIPEFILELRHYHECMDELVPSEKTGSAFQSVEMEGVNRFSGVFGLVFYGELEERRISQGLDFSFNANYFPEFNYGSDYVSQGMIFDYQTNSFSRLIGWSGDGLYEGKEGIWDILSNFSEVEGCYFEEEDFTFDELNEILEEPENNFSLLLWFFSLATVGFLNFYEMPSIHPNAAEEERYQRGMGGGYKIDKRNDTYFVPDVSCVYPKLSIKMKGNFNTIFTYEKSKTLENLLHVFEGFGSTKSDIKRFIAKTKKDKIDVLGVLGFETLEWHSKKAISENDIEVFFNTIESFCYDEIKSGRPYLAFLIGLYSSWLFSETRSTRFAARLLQKVPDEICHPLIKRVVEIRQN